MAHTRYPDYNVMDSREEWDEHTRSVVEGRMKPPGPLMFFNESEAADLKTLLSALLAEEREELLLFVLHSIDRKLADNKTDGYHKAGLPAQREMFRQGLAALAAPCGGSLQGRDPKSLSQLITQWSEQGFPGNDPPWGMDFFYTLLKEALSYYYSHPVPWSEIGYGGPAYPRGYVRIELGATDPWEAVKPHE